MVNLDLSNLETLTAEQIRVLAAVEQGMRNHRYVPVPLINQISGARSTGMAIRDLLKIKLLEHVGANDAYCLSYLGYDYLAMTVLKKRGIISSVGSRIGIGKEADVYFATTPSNQQIVIKFHKLGLSSFKQAKSKRMQYLENRKSASWMYFSRLSAVREFGFMAELKRRQFKVPQPISINRHAVAMQYVDGYAMSRLRGLSGKQAAHLGWELFLIMVRLLRIGVVHGDCNEYNVIVQINDRWLGMLDQDEEKDINELDVKEAEALDGITRKQKKSDEDEIHPDLQLEAVIKELVNPVPLSEEKQFINNVVLIDFPQMISVSDPEAPGQFDRDIDSFEPFLNRRFGANLKLPRFQEIIQFVQKSQEMETTEKAAVQSAKQLEADVEEISDEQGEGEEGELELEENERKPEAKVKRIDVKAQARKEALKQERHRTQKGRFSKGAARGSRMEGKNKGSLDFD